MALVVVIVTKLDRQILALSGMLDDPRLRDLRHIDRMMLTTKLRTLQAKVARKSAELEKHEV